MKPTASIELFLYNLKCFVKKNSFIFIPREASRQYMSSRGITILMLTKIILDLKPSDCFDGPEADRNPRYADTWTVAEFSPVYDGEMLYLKLSICTDEERVKCLSVKLYVERNDTDE